MTDYLERARAQLADEDRVAAEARLQQRITDLRERDERAQRHRELCIEHGLVETASPREISDAMMKREAEFWSGFIGKSHATFPARYAALCGEIGLDATKVERSDVWLRMRETGHRLCRPVRNPVAGGFIDQPADPRLDKVRELARRPGTAGEGQAAQAALERIGGAVA